MSRRLHFFNDVIYERLPAVYNAVDSLTFGVWWQLVKRALLYTPTNGNVLEIGFGPGRLQTELVRRSDSCFGLDLAWGMCRFTQHRLQKANLPSQLTNGSVLSLPYPNNCFDSVVSTFAFSGFPNGGQALTEMARVTAVGGYTVLVDIGYPPDGNRLGTMLARLWQSMGDHLYDMPNMMTTVGLNVTIWDAFGPGNHIHAVVGQKTW